MRNPVTPPDWFTKDPYRPSNSTQGDSNPEAIFSAVGKLTHTWEMLEHIQQITFAVLTVDQSTALPALTGGRLQTSSAAMQAYGAVVSSQSRWDMLAAASSAFSKMFHWPEIEKNLLRVKKFAVKLVGLRNIAAHGIVVSLNGDHFRSINDFECEGSFFIVPAFYNLSKMKDSFLVNTWYSSQALSEIQTAVSWLRFELMRTVLFQIINGPDDLSNIYAAYSKVDR